MKIKNAKPQIYYGLHMLPGVAQYDPPGEESYKIFINESTIKQMDPTFKGLPVYVQHKDEVDLEKVQEEADGYVVRSFYNAADGKHWAEFIVVSDKGHQAIRNGWRLSNAYIPKILAEGGLWNGVEYQKEVTKGEYEHLALVPNPRYDESIIMTPEQFKTYNADKATELKRLANSKSKEKPMLNFFKKSKVENSEAVDMENIVVVLPKSGVEMNLSKLVNEHDKIVNMHGYASPDHMVNMGDEELSVNDMQKGYGKMKAKLNEYEEKEKEEKDKENGKKKKKNGEDEKPAEAAAEEAKPEGAEGTPEAEKLSNEADKAAEEDAAHFEALKNAPADAIIDPIEIDMDKTARGKARYGSN